MKKNVLVTGSAGFIGRNLCTFLDRRRDVAILTFDIADPENELWQKLDAADFVFHLAGINRPQVLGEFETGNRGFTEEIVAYLEKKQRKVPFLLSSSIQAEIDNPYGKSKLGAEAAVVGYGRHTGAQTYVFRLPNVFGKWCRPNYNSVIATWCYNTTHGLPIQINDPGTELRLAYIDDVVHAFVEAMDDTVERGEDGYCVVATVYRKTLKSISTSLLSFVASRQNLVMPSFDDDFTRKLYATWLSYLPGDGFGYRLDMKRDNRGWLAEFIKSPAFGQIFVSTTKPGITRGNHFHHTKVEKFLVIAGKALINLRPLNGEGIMEYSVSGEDLRVIDIPPGYTHSITNIGEDDLITLFWSDEIFNSDAPDTYFLEV